MDGKEQQKRVARLSTVSLDSTSDEDDKSAIIMKRPIQNRCAWTPFMVLAGLILVTVGLVVALDHGHDSFDGDLISAAHSSLTSSQGLSAPKQKVVEWLKQAHNASELYIEGGSRNMSVTGVLFPQTDRDTSLPFNAMVAINSVGTLPRRQYVALANGRGFKWVVTSLGYGDLIVTSGCLTASPSLPFDELDLIAPTAKWRSDDKNEVTVILDDVPYKVSKEEDDYFLSIEVDDQCWTIEGEENKEIEIRVCTSVAGEQLLPNEFEELFNATTECPQLARTTLSVPLPLRKWYASYQAS